MATAQKTEPQSVDATPMSGPDTDGRPARGTGAQAAKNIKNHVSVPTRGRVMATETPHTTSASKSIHPSESDEGADIIHDLGANNMDALPGRESGIMEGSFSPSSTRQRRRAKKDPPFIQSKHISLTYPQAKLFGLAGPACSWSPPKLATTSSECAQSVPLAKVLRAARTAPWHSSATNREHSNRDLSSVEKERGKYGGGHTGNSAKYSTSRMEDLARPTAGFSSDNGAGSRSWQDNGGTGGGGEAPFAWKRTRKAEAAMRNPACGYDFVAESGGLPDKKGFLGRVEAYSLHSRAKMETRRAKEEYDARIDKLQCRR